MLAYSSHIRQSSEEWSAPPRSSAEDMAAHSSWSQCCHSVDPPVNLRPAPRWLPRKGSLTVGAFPDTSLETCRVDPCMVWGISRDGTVFFSTKLAPPLSTHLSPWIRRPATPSMSEERLLWSWSPASRKLSLWKTGCRICRGASPVSAGSPWHAGPRSYPGPE